MTNIKLTFYFGKCSYCLTPAPVFINTIRSIYLSLLLICCYVFDLQFSVLFKCLITIITNTMCSNVQWLHHSQFSYLLLKNVEIVNHCNFVKVNFFKKKKSFHVGFTICSNFLRLLSISLILIIK